MRLFDGIDRVSFVLQGTHGLDGILVILPFDGLFGTEGGFMYLWVGRAATDAAEHNTLDTHGVGGTENGSYIMLAAHIVQYYH